MSRQPSLVVAPWGLDHEQDVVVLEAVLGALRPWVVRVQTDVPLSLRAGWAPRVAAAADLRVASSTRHRGDDTGYATTGWLPASDEGLWAAFATFAGWAFDADARAVDGPLVALSDLAASVVLRVDTDQRAAVETVLGGRQLVVWERAARTRRARS